MLYITAQQTEVNQFFFFKKIRIIWTQVNKHVKLVTHATPLA